MKIRLRTAAAFIAAALLLAGCGSSLSLWSQKAEPPSFALADMELQGIKGLETIFRLRIRVANPGDEPLEIRGLNCEMQLDGKPFAEGVSDERVAVPELSSSTVSVTIYATSFELAGAVIDLLQKKSPSQPEASDKPLLYELSGRLRTGDEGEDVVPFWLKGALPLKKQ